MGSQMKSAITPTRNEDYPEWYQQVIRAAELAENSPVRGCMVIKPWGYTLWENIRDCLDGMLKDSGHVNAYFPLFIPLSFLEKEAKHVKGFAKECAVVTHHRLEENPAGGLMPAAPLEEPLVIRPTSETIIGATYSKWVQSYRDLPILINQWANVVRWEMRTRLFLRTTEFLWQEGHTVHETRDEAWEETLSILSIYRAFAEKFMAMPVVTGEKTAAERFPGADNTFCIEAMMQDRKALQSGTSHFLGQNFAKASDIQFTSRSGEREFAWTTSWGVSTRLIGGLVMTHGDDDGMVMPPRLAPAHVVILPIMRSDADVNTVMTYCENLAADLRQRLYHGKPLVVVLDKRELNAGEKSWQWVKKGIPLRVEVGPRDIAANQVYVGRRDRKPREKCGVPREEFINSVTDILDDMQNGLLQRALSFRETHTADIDDLDDFYSFFTPDSEGTSIHGGFARSPWCGSSTCEERINEDLSVTIRCLPDGYKATGGDPCVVCGTKSEGRAIFAKAY